MAATRPAAQTALLRHAIQIVTGMTAPALRSRDGARRGSVRAVMTWPTYRASRPELADRRKIVPIIHVCLARIRIFRTCRLPTTSQRTRPAANFALVQHHCPRWASLFATNQACPPSASKFCDGLRARRRDPPSWRTRRRSLQRARALARCSGAERNVVAQTTEEGWGGGVRRPAAPRRSSPKSRCM